MSEKEAQMSEKLNSTPLLELENVTRDFGATRALDSVSLAVYAGRSSGIVGESGAGKSTILNILMGLDTPTSGEVRFRGAPLPRTRADLRTFRSTVQMVFQDPRSSLDPRMNVGRIIAEPLRSLKIPGDHRARVDEVLKMVGLEPDMTSRFPAQFSGGQRQRIAIARALAPRPELLMADEPVSALDVSVKAQLVQVLAELKENLGLTMLMVSHDVGIVRLLCEEMVVLRHGHVEEAGPTDRILASATQTYTRELLAAIPVL